MAVGRIHRLLRLITLLQSGQGKTIRELIAQLGVSRRTVFRDLNMLAEAGIPYYHEPGHGYRIARSYYLPPVNLTVPETLSMMLLAKSAIAQRDRPMMDAAISAIAKLTSTVPEPLRDACAAIMETISVQPGAQGTGDVESQHYNTLQQCIDEGRACDVTYRSPLEARPAPLRIEPYVLHFCARAWYLMARSRRHNQVRIFKLARMLSLKPLPRRFDKPRNFKAADKIGKAWQLIPEGKIYKIELEFAAMVGTSVAEVRWHPSQQHETPHDRGGPRCAWA